MKLEEEFSMRKQMHKVNVCVEVLMADIMYEIDHSESLNLPSFLLRNEIGEEVKRRILASAEKGTFESLYSECWEKYAQVTL